MSFVFLFAEFVLISIILLGGVRFGITPVAVAVAAMQFMQAVLGATLYWEFADGLLLSPGSCVFFASNLAILLYVYATRGSSDARTIFYAIVGSNLLVVALSALLSVHIQTVAPVNFLDLPVGIFGNSLFAAAIGATVLVLTQLIGLTTFNQLRSRWPVIPMSIAMAIALMVALAFDTFGYLVPLFWGDPNLGSMLTSGVISKGAAGALFGVTWGAWAQRNRSQRAESLRDLFKVLTWGDRAESFRTDTAELYRKSELDSDSDFGASPNSIVSEGDWSEERFQQWLTRLPFGVCVFGGEEIKLVNANFAAQVGETSRENLPGRTISRYVRSGDLDVLRRAAEESGGDAERRAIEHDLLRADGTTTTVESEVLEVNFEGASAMVLMARDITEKKQLRDQISHTDRLAVVGTLTATITHEINNPLAYLLANHQFMLDAIERLRSTASPQLAAQLDDLAEAGEDAHEGARRIKSVVRELGKFTRSDAQEVSPVDLAREIETSITLAMPKIKRRAVVVRDIGEVPRVDAHPQRLGQVVLNLLVNAAQAIEEGAEADNEIRISAATEGPSVVVRVSDTGSGIEPEDQERIMKPFFTTKPAGQGTGLGLATCRSIVGSYGGEMGFDSAPGEGSTFWFRLPISSAHTPEEASEPTAQVETAEQRRVLIIDDERALARVFSRMIAPHDATICSSGGEALALLEENDDFDIIFCDLMMPNMSGPDFYRKLVDRGSPLTERMVFITGSAFLPSAQSFLDTVDLPCLKKPFDWDKVYSLIEECTA